MPRKIPLKLDARAPRPKEDGYIAPIRLSHPNLDRNLDSDDLTPCDPWPEQRIGYTDGTQHTFLPSVERLEALRSYLARNYPIASFDDTDL